MVLRLSKSLSLQEPTELAENFSAVSVSSCEKTFHFAGKRKTVFLQEATELAENFSVVSVNSCTEGLWLRFLRAVVKSV